MRIFAPSKALQCAEVTRDFARCLVATAAPPPAPHAPGAAAPPPPPSPAAPPDGVVAGFVVGWLVAGELQVLELAVHPDHRRKGLGAALLARLMADCGCDASAPATLEVRAGNAAALALYTRLGFVEAGRRRRYYADESDAVLMTRPPGPLAPPLGA
ncbi:ribosomal-protein-alanineN-acetyltransferase [Monoraphidium neglectum]|uniref:Ribosomal-protein-alanineN-acetyltransferase n=1 Tax=Monoraphidium neglectum TaxID=145388 RepID=A0A0D2J1C0_9CHLO|nr:ribosomal-protein-alanineN-acetyltransferase [Monoraphidium neglectum]KIY93842.1 ribosomal-protein-alanineN-acetyltransferase [Monoraphidium neglectum]|eukprot:XP_013892862.1 ribosomal-protein-alanineN-acetyltransferase [Monoraphidium neglectum]